MRFGDQCQSHLKSNFQHFARYLNLEISISAQECWGRGGNFLTLLLAFRFVSRHVPGSPELPIMNPNSVMADCVVPLVW